MGILIGGIDPGLKGGLAFLCEDGTISEIYRMPKFITDIKPILLEMKPARVFVEQQRVMPMEGVKSCFTNGLNFGKILGTLECLEIPYELVGALTWQKAVGCNGTTSTPKERAFVKARALWPGHTFIFPKCFRPHNGAIDACLIAEYGRLKNVGKKD
tara:strand:- start:283 stop:753 length:471 start_codon:yes stop_codon:yes gene_type:complete